MDKNKVDLSAPLRRGHTLTIKNEGRYSNQTLADAVNNKTPLEFYGIECIVLDMVLLFFDDDHELKIKANNK